MMEMVKEIEIGREIKKLKEEPPRPAKFSLHTTFSKLGTIPFLLIFRNGNNF
jgi:hypothetical protein